LVASTKVYSLCRDYRYIIHGSHRRTLHNKKLVLGGLSSSLQIQNEIKIRNTNKWERLSRD